MFADRPLTPRQMDFVSLIVDARTNEEIATAMNLSVQTVKNTISIIMEKTKSRNRVEVAVKFKDRIGIQETSHYAGTYSC